MAACARCSGEDLLDGSEPAGRRQRYARVPMRCAAGAPPAYRVDRGIVRWTGYGLRRAHATQRPAAQEGESLRDDRVARLREERRFQRLFDGEVDGPDLRAAGLPLDV
jgi:hypothetical protein